jgi:Sperm-tail PG-rich repeat
MPRAGIAADQDGTAIGEGAAAPGPGQYNVPEVATGPAFTIAGRHATDGSDKDDGPGPGAHELGAIERGPAFTIAARTGDGTAAATPTNAGPGAYDLPSVDTGPSFTIQVSS